jgi:hypothetical protein
MSKAPVSQREVAVESETSFETAEGIASKLVTVAERRRRTKSKK